jgi:hypothetical protein
MDMLVFFFSGNDFIEQRFYERMLPPLVDESPGSSIVRRVMPNGFTRTQSVRDLTAIAEGPSWSCTRGLKAAQKLSPPRDTISVSRSSLTSV